MEVRVGDAVDVPGGMYGTVKFVGEVAGKKGKFAGVQLAAEYAVRGKNSGDVDGKYYFKTTKPGAGIFLPVEKAIRRGPATPSATSLANFNQGGRTPALPKPNFSQSIGPGARAASPAFKPSSRRPSLPRPESPLRRTPSIKPAAPGAAPGSRPSFGLGSKSKAGTGSRYGQSPMGRTSTFGASLRGTSATASRTPLGPEPSFDEDSQSTPTPTPSAPRTIDHTMKDEEAKRLKASLEEKDRQLKEQANTLSDMEKSLAELQSLLPADPESSDHRREVGAGSEDAIQMRSILREKNEKIQMLIAEFDAHRADFRSTIDTLEMASTETERVYEKRVEELLQEVRDLQDRAEDVDTVAQQLKQLEELVQELEEGLEDARRGEAEARGEVEFLRGEVERGRSELKKEKSKVAAAGAREDYSDNSSNRSSSARELEAKDDEIRGLKAIIHSLSGSAPGSGASAGKARSDITANGHFPQDKVAAGEQREQVQETTSSREAELEHELEQLRASVTSSSSNNNNKNTTATSHALSPSEPHKPRSNTLGSRRLSDRTIVPAGDTHEQQQQPNGQASQLETMHETDARSTDTDSSAPWCEICETVGHDILTCTNVFANGNGSGTAGDHGQQQQQHETPLTLHDTPPRTSSASKFQPSNIHSPLTAASPPSPSPLPLSSATAATAGDDGLRQQPPPYPSTNTNNINNKSSLTPIHPAAATDSAGMVAGKSSGVIDADKWCALCERDGHDSVDCPFEDGF